VAARMILGLDAYLTDWLNLLFRWLHVIAAMAWIGTSFYFVFLDNALRPPESARDREAGATGELWAVHGGGFYHVQKHPVSPTRLPEPLHWFKWEAYTTWLSGFALLVVLYYFHADTYLIDPSVADLSTGEAVAISLAGLVLAWVVYDVLCRAVKSDIVVGAAIVGLSALTAWAAGELFSGHGAFIQVGAMLGTIMAANVLFVIIPAHWELIHAKQEGRPPRLERGLEAKRRSVHNNYLTLPVLLTMLSGHFPFLYGREHAWLVLIALMLIGAWVRHYFNLRRRGRTVIAIPVTAALATVALAWAIQPDDTKPAAGSEPVTAAQAQAIVERRCVTCHSASPTNDQFKTAPAGVVLDSPQEIAQRAEQIRALAVDSTAMPLGNVTGMTKAEREELGAWIAAGAPVQ
jgi:uncharacterized membrane protein